MLTEICNGYVCERPGAVCIVGEDSQPGCECPQGCTTHEEVPVCGLLYGREPETFYNLCKLKRVACLYELPYTLLHDGLCEGKKSYYPHFEGFVHLAGGHRMFQRNRRFL